MICHHSYVGMFNKLSFQSFFRWIDYTRTMLLTLAVMTQIFCLSRINQDRYLQRVPDIVQAWFGPSKNVTTNFFFFVLFKYPRVPSPFRRLLCEPLSTPVAPTYQQYIILQSQGFPEDGRHFCDLINVFAARSLFNHSSLIKKKRNEE